MFIHVSDILCLNYAKPVRFPSLMARPAMRNSQHDEKFDLSLQEQRKKVWPQSCDITPLLSLLKHRAQLSTCVH